MDYKPLTAFKYRDPVLAWLVGAGGTGKTTLAAAFAAHYGPAVLIPSDQRLNVYNAMHAQYGGAFEFTIYPVPQNPALWTDGDAILEEVPIAWRKTGAKAGVWDSISPVFREKVMDAQEIANMTPAERAQLTGNASRSAAYQEKAAFMERLSLLTNLGISWLWISHEFEGRDGQGRQVMKTTITEQETKKFTRNLNLKLRTFINEKGVYCVEIVWARDKPSLNGRVLEDKTGHFGNIWPTIDQMLQFAPSVSFFDRVKFSADEAQNLAAEMTVTVDGQEVFVFGDKDGSGNGRVNHAVNTYNQVRKRALEAGVNTAEDFAKMWKDEVRRRIQAKESGSDPEVGEEETDDQGKN